MSAYDPSELLVFCDSIIEDGELSYDEIYKLAEWLNNHQEACHHWPGNLLIEPLQKCWADGKISKTEARQMARLLLRIQKESAKRRSTEILAKVFDLAVHAARTFDPTVPRLPSIPVTVRVKSRTDKGKFYDVNLSDPTCTCPDFRTHRKRLATGHLTRCCKHVFDAYSQIEPSGGWPAWLRAYLDVAWTPYPSQDWLILKVDLGFVLISSAPNGWANVFASDRGPYDRYGYSIPENRWSYGIAPPASDRISRAVVAFDKSS